MIRGENNIGNRLVGGTSLAVKSSSPLLYFEFMPAFRAADPYKVL